LSPELTVPGADPPYLPGAGAMSGGTSYVVVITLPTHSTALRAAARNLPVHL